MAGVAALSLPLWLSLNVALGCVISYVVCFDKHSSAPLSLLPEIDSWKKQFQNHCGSLFFFFFLHLSEPKVLRPQE